MKDTFKFVLLIAIAVLTLANTVLLINWEVRVRRIGNAMHQTAAEMDASMRAFDQAMSSEELSVPDQNRQ